MKATHKRSWPTKRGLHWFRITTVFGPGSIWNGRPVKKRNHLMRRRWSVVEVVECSRDKVAYYDDSGYPRREVTRPPKYKFHRYEWVVAIPPS